MRRLRVVSWNVGRLYTPSSNNRLADADLPQVARVLHELDADVVLLQELVEERQLAELCVRLPAYAGRLAEKCRYDRHVAVLARRALEPAFEQYVLEDTGRGLCAVTFSVGHGRRGAAFPVHFDVFDRARRRSQAEEIRALTDGRQEALVVVGGDLNLDPEWAGRVGSALDVDTYAMFGAQFAEAGLPAGPTLLGLFRVDHLFVRGSGLSRLHTRVSPGRRLPMGDHDPLVGDVELSVDAAQPTL
jgi:endonuclease/exonuclease/phosphatase family metal-dependent hydrolase